MYLIKTSALSTRFRRLYGMYLDRHILAVNIDKISAELSHDALLIEGTIYHNTTFAPGICSKLSPVTLTCHIIYKRWCDHFTDVYLDIDNILGGND